MSDAVGEFWGWWATVRDEVDASIKGGEGPGEDFVAAMAERVDAIAPELDWELAPGREADHALVVSSGGDPEVRAPARRWLLAAPPADATWEYHDARQGDPSAADEEIEVDGQDLDLSQTVIASAIDERRAEVDVVVHHPAFAELERGQAVRVAFLLLDWMVGEEEVERWIGSIDVATEPPGGARPARELLERVEEVRASRAGESGAILEREEDDGTTTLAVTTGALKPVDHPLLDTRVSITVRFQPREDGLPDRPELERLRELERDLLGTLGDDAFLAVHVTNGGRRRFELYADGASDAPDRARRWAAEHDAEAEVARDAGWDGVKPYR